MRASREFLAFVDRCQVAVGDARWDAGSRSFDALLSQAPLMPTVTEQLLAEALVGRLKDGIAAHAGPADARASATAPARRAHLVRRALIWIDRHHTEAVTAAQLASAIGVSRCHLARVLTNETRHGVRWHLAEARTRHAERLIRESQLSLKEIAARAGFCSASDLSRQFHHRRGLAPSTLTRRGRR